MISRIPKEQLSDDSDARRIIIINWVRGRREYEGYKFVPELGISVQGQKATYAWKGASHIARQLGIPLEVEFLRRGQVRRLSAGLPDQPQNG